MSMIFSDYDEYFFLVLQVLQNKFSLHCERFYQPSMHNVMKPLHPHALDDAIRMTYEESSAGKWEGKVIQIKSHIIKKLLQISISFLCQAIFEILDKSLSYFVPFSARMLSFINLICLILRNRTKLTIG